MLARKVYSLVFLLLNSIVLLGQKVEFEQITERNGALNSSVTSIVKDSYGYMWFGTLNGLTRYDGYNFFNYFHDANDSLSLCNNNILTLFYESKDSLLYIGTKSEGFCIYNMRTESFKRFYHKDKDVNSLSSNQVLDILGDSKGNIWIGTREGLDKFDPKKETFTHYLPFNKIKQKSVISIEEDEEGNVWFYGLSNFLCYYNVNTNSFNYLKFSNNASYDSLYFNRGEIKCIANGKMWLGNKQEGLVLIDLKSGKTEILPELNKLLMGYNVLCVQEDSENNVWIGTDGIGLFKFYPDTKTFTNFIHKSSDPLSISGNVVYEVYESHPGLLWVGTYTSGLNIINTHQKKFIKYTDEGEPGKKLNQKSVLAFAKADDGKVWIGTDGGGLNLFDRKNSSFSYFKEENNKLCADVIKSLLPDKKGNLWCGTYGKGICKVDLTKGTIGKKIKTINSPINLTRDNVWSLLETSDGKIWMGLIAGGVNIYDTKTESFTTDFFTTVGLDKFSNVSILTIFEDRKRRIWIGSERNGAACYNPVSKKITLFTFEKGNATSIPSNDIRDIFEDSHGTIWIATKEGGLSRLIDLNKKIFKTYTTKDGLPTNTILSILEDDNDNLWLSSLKGITCFNMKDLKFQNFDVEDGLQDKEFNYGAKLKMPEGYLLFGGIKGFNIFHPDSLNFNTFKPAIVITDFKIFNHSLHPNASVNGKVYLTKSIYATQEIELDYHDDVFSIEFAALNFIVPLKNNYAYKLEGFDKDWTYVNAEKRFATYTNLDPGTYTFKVIGSNNDNVWNTQGASLTITILPPWWTTWWFKVISVFFIINAVLVFIYIRLKSVKAQNKLLEEEVKKQTAELKQVNSDLMEKNYEITLKSEILEENNLEISRKTARILEQQDKILKQNSELDELNKTKDKFFSILAHDLKNPVNAMTVLSKMLRREFSVSNDSGRELISNIEISSERIKNLVLNLLEWARSQTGNIKVDPTKISVYKLVEENIQLHIPQASYKGIVVQAEIDPSHYIYADYNMVSTIVRNILSNSIKYTEKGGEVLIFSEVTDDKRIILSFKDNGVGMNEEILNKLFKINNSFSTMGTENETGTGLGMILCKEFVELNRGKIIVKSKPGVGSAFHVTLPGGIELLSEFTKVNTLPASFETPVKTKPPIYSEDFYIRKEFRGRKILLVDDDEQVRNAVKYILSDTFEVFEATNVNNAIALSEKIFPDLIISDIVMPGETGISFCHSVKSHKLTCHIPVILLTGQSSEETHLEGLLAGADAYITKPFDRKIFLSTINNLLTSLENIKMRFSSDPEILISDVATSKYDEELLSKAIHFIEANISNPDLNGDLLCKEIGISKSVLYIKLKNLTGQTVNEFIRVIRLKKSISLLLAGELNIAQISAEMGFNSPSYFTRSFTQHFGLSPKDYVAKQKSTK